MTLHRDLTGSDLHEPKGIETVSAGTSYISNGEGTGEWKLIGPDEIDQTEIRNVNKYKLHCLFPDISTAKTIFLPVSEDSTLVNVTCVMNGALTGADASLEFRNSGIMSMGTLIVPFTSSGQGVVVSMIPTGNNAIVAPGSVVIICDGASTGTVDLHMVLDFEYD